MSRPDEPVGEPTGPLTGLRIIDATSVIAGPLACQILGDFGADVIKIEHPTEGDALRGAGHRKNDVSLWWKVMARNKRSVGLQLGDPDGATVFRRLVATVDVVIEGFRSGTLERWGIGPEVLREDNAGLVVVRITGFGQQGPYAERPGFGTLAEAMSGFAAMTGQPDGPPTLPPMGLADGIAGISIVSAVLMALRHRDRTGEGQVVDVNLLEPILHTTGPMVPVYDALGIIPERVGNRSRNSAPRNTYRCADGKWVAVSSANNRTAVRLLTLVGHEELTREPWFSTGLGRAEHAELLDKYVGEWMAVRTRPDVLAACDAAEVVVGPVYDVADLVEDPHVQATEMITRVDDDELGPLAMHNMLFRMSASPGSIRHTGPSLGVHTDEVLGKELGLTPAELTDLRSRGVIT